MRWKGGARGGLPPRFTRRQEKRHLPLSRSVEREVGKRERERERKRKRKREVEGKGEFGREKEEKWRELIILTSVLACM